MIFIDQPTLSQSTH